jgi:hypothetical protein
MPQENDELELVLKYHILVQTRKLTYYINCGILFLSIIVIGTKSSIQFVQALGNVSYIKIVVRIMILHMQETCVFIIRRLFQQLNMKITSQIQSIWIRISR